MSSSQLAKNDEFLVRTSINSILLRFMLFSVYSVVYTGTMYLCFKERSRPNLFIIVAGISIAYFCSLLDILCQWFMVQWTLDVTAVTQNTVTVLVSKEPVWYDVVDNVVDFVVPLIANALLIWRCYHIWCGSLRAIILPALFSLGAISVYLTMMVKTYSTPDLDLADQNVLIGTAVFLDLGSSLLSSGLISWKIASFIKRSSAYPFSTLGHFNSNWRIRFALEIIIQSAAAYSMVSIAYAIVSVLPTDTQTSYAAIDAAQLYLSDLFTFTAGIAPTVMVARVLAASDKGYSPTDLEEPAK